MKFNTSLISPIFFSFKDYYKKSDHITSVEQCLHIFDDLEEQKIDTPYHKFTVILNFIKNLFKIMNETLFTLV